MVHALEQIHRVLIPSGCLIDLRPARGVALSGRSRMLPTVSCVTRRRIVKTGFLQKGNIEEHHAATRAIEEVLSRGRFVIASTETFPFRWHFRTLPLLDAYIETRWSTTALPPSGRRRLQATLSKNRSARIVVEDIFQLNVLEKA